MARATRSTAQHQEKEKEKEKQLDPSTSQPRNKSTSKKRKRASVPDNEDQPATKQLRTDSTVKKEGSLEPESILTNETKLPQLQNAGDVPIDPADAQKILDILEMIDTQGLLDRVFPLPAESLASQPASFSLRNLLKESSQHPLSVLHSAVQHLIPISSHPRSRPSIPAVQQLRFCNLARSLLDQASFHSTPIPLDLETILPSSPEALFGGVVNGVSKPSRYATTEPASPSPTKKRKYALMQRLSTGDWWTSLNSDFSSPSQDGRDFKDLHTAYADLVAILPSSYQTAPSSSSVTPLSKVPTLGSYNSMKTPGPKPKLPAPRRISCGTFLDYGPYASFAPTFDQDGVEVGRRTLGEVVWCMEERRRRRESETTHLSLATNDSGEPADITMDDDVDELPVTNESYSQQSEERNLKKGIENSFEGFLPAEQIDSITTALGCLELENAVHELLQRTGRALKRLEELQRIRLSSEDGGSSQVEEGSEEWETAQEILNSLITLASLRPRSSSDVSETPPLIPPSSVLNRLYLTLPLTPSQGWHGTLPPSRPTSLRDDSTLRLRSGATISANNAANAAAAAPAATGTPAGVTPTPLYAGYSYSNYASTPYRAGYTPYKPGQTPTYYPAPYTPAQGQSGSQVYYSNQNYNTTGQQQYSYGSWYSYQPQATAAAAAAATTGTSSGRGTPQPGATASPSALATNYAGFFGSAGQPQPAGQRAVANTVVASKSTGTSSLTPGTAAGNTVGYVPPTLPYLRNSAGTPTTTAAGHQPQQQQHNHYAPSAQPTPSVPQ